MSVAGRSTYAAAVDPQRSTSSAAASQGPVLAAWGVVRDPPQFPSAPFPEMPPAAAAAVSPIVPGASAAAAPPDPYGRCWQNQVDAGACFPYFGTLYGSSLPPPSYRMQPGCMSNLGQFWPPTPPPDGCVRYDSANNLHFCSPLTPMFRHSESLPQNMIGVHQQRLGYSHLIDVNKDAGLKRLDACMDNVQRQKIVLPSKQSKDSLQQSLCHCYECNEKSSHSLTPSINKENIVRSVHQRYSDEKLKSKSCKKLKDENISRSTANYHTNSSAITSFSCSLDQNTTKASLQAQDSIMRNSQKSEASVITSSGLQYEFAHPNNSSNLRCRSSSGFSIPSSNAITPVVSTTTAKCSEAPRFESIEKQRRLPTSIPGFDSYTCPPVQTPSSLAHHPSDKSCCFSPPYLSSRTLYPNHSENYVHNKPSNGFVLHGNNYNASPLKNVYFSYYESENFDLASNASTRKHSRSNVGKHEKLSNSSYINNRPLGDKPVDYLVTTANNLHNFSPALSNSYSYRNQSKTTTIPISVHAPLQQSSFLEQPKNDSNFCNYLGTMNNKRSEKSAFSKHTGKTNSAFIKQEKPETFDCKFQKSNADDNVRISQLPITSSSSEVLNLSTSLKCPKIEPSDAECHDETNTLSQNHSTFSTSSTSLTLSSPQTITCKSSTLLNDVTSNYSSNGLPFCNLDKKHGIQDATSLRIQPLENQCAQVVPEDFVSVGQVAPIVDEFAILNKMPPTGSEAPADIVPNVNYAEKNNAVNETHQDSVSSLVAVQPIESADVSQFMPQLEKCPSPLCFQDEMKDTLQACKEESKIDNFNEISLEKSCAIEPPQIQADYDKSDLIDITENITLETIKMENNSSPLESHSLNGSPVNESQNCEQEVECCESKEDQIISPVLDHSNSSMNDDTSEKENPAYHGLYLLLQGIDHQCNVNKISNDAVKTVSLNDNNSSQSCDSGKKSDKTTMKSLNLLCALVEKRFTEEFGDEVQSTLNNETPVNQGDSNNLNSNYPETETNKNDISAPTSQDNEDDQKNSKEDTTVLEMRKKLAELQQQYKEKQKELARLKPKKSTAFDTVKKNIETSSKSSECSENSSLSSHAKEISDEKLLEITKPSSEMDLKTGPNNFELAKCPVKTTKSIIASNVLKSTEENSDHCLPNAESSSVSVKIDISLGICKSSKRTVRRSLVKRKLELRSSKHTITLSDNNSIKSKTNRKGRLNRLKNSMLDEDESNTNDHCNSLNDEPKVVSSEMKKLEKKIKSTKKKSIKSTNNDLTENCSIKKSRLETKSILDVTDEIKIPVKSPKKRKAENPKKFMPSKHVRLTETIIAKQLRNRILFENSESRSIERQNQKRYDVPEELFDALRKCHLSENSSDKSKLIPNIDNSHDIDSSKEAYSELRMTPDCLIENQRILALEDGLFYAGCIKEIQNSDTYGIVLDGQRGNKKHMFSKEEMLTQTILELKPKSVDELPEGTRVCAYWSHQYRCLYPGTVVKGPDMLKSQTFMAWDRPKQAPTPSVDWSEPRVFVEFDDGDSAQIATKNIRFLPSDMQISDEADSEVSMPNLVPAVLTEECTKEKSTSKGKRKKKETMRSSKKLAKLSKIENSAFKHPSNCSNASSYDLCSTKDFPSHSVENDGDNVSPNRKSSKRTLSQSLPKKSQDSHSKLKELSSMLEKNKKHKKYKDRHKHHHHHHHHRHHHRHCHRHRHCRKHKHHKRTPTEEPASEVISVVIPSSNSIPFADAITAKTTRNSESHRHSRKSKLPQISNGLKTLESTATEPYCSAKTDTVNKNS